MYNRDVYKQVMKMGTKKSKEQINTRQSKHTKNNHKPKQSYSKQPTNSKQQSNIDNISSYFPQYEITKLFKEIMKPYVHKIEFKYDNRNVCKTYKYMRLIPYGQRGYLWIKQYYGKTYTLFGTFSNRKIKFVQINVNIKNEHKQLLSVGKHGTIIYGCLTNNNVDNNSYSSFIIEHICMFQSNNLLEHYSIERNIKFQLMFIDSYIDQDFNGLYNKNTYNKTHGNKKSITFICLSNTLIFKDPKHNSSKSQSFANYIGENLFCKNMYAMQIYNEYEMIYENRKMKSITDTLKNVLDVERKTKVFNIQPDVIDDIYMIYDMNTHNFIGNVLIQTYKTSVYMNSIFRNIKENNNLDLLEESDDESDFENVEQEKYITCREKQMKLVYNERFKGWEPLLT